ncbi:RNA polymerase subunit sigma-24, partial [Streptomyces vinaceus]
SATTQLHGAPRAPGRPHRAPPERGARGGGPRHAGTTVTVAAFDLGADRVTHIWAVRNPEKLRAWNREGAS